jgi:dTMP kinase
MSSKGKFIVIDGSDGSGKKTQADLLIKKLKAEKKKAVMFDFPQYDKFFGKLVKRYLSGEFGGLKDVDAHLASVLYAADRWQAKKEIENYLSKGYIVISNRYAESNMAHQSAKISSVKKRGEFLKWLDEMEFKNFKIPRADLVLYLNVPIEIGQKLVENRGNKKDIHELDIAYLKKTRKQYLDLASKNRHWQKIDCTQKKEILSREEIAKQVWQSAKRII